MSRTVEVPCDALYATFVRTDPDTEQWDFDWQIEHYQESLEETFYSVYTDHGRISRETRIVASNKVAYFTVSTYGELVCLAVVPKDGREERAARWFRLVGRAFLGAVERTWGPRLARAAVFSNGEALYRLAGA